MITSTPYLQVPKVLPHRKSRSRSSSRPRAVEPAESNTSKTRLPSGPPASEMVDHYERRLSGFAHASTPRSLAIKGPDLYSTKVDREANSSSGSSLADSAISIIAPPEDLNGGIYTLSSSPSPPPQLTLRERLIGAWYLESYIAYPTASCKIQRPTYPMTKNVTGIIMYTPDGYMSAHMLIPGQASFKRGEGEEAQWAEAGKRSFCYAGPYYISNEGFGRRETLRHTFQVCNLPGWLNDVQIRTWTFEENDDLLVLGSEAPTEIKVRITLPFQ